MATWFCGVVVMVMVVIMTAPVSGDVKDGKWVRGPKWTFYVPLGSEVLMTCNNSDVFLFDGDKLEWRNPNDEIIESTKDNLNKYELVNRNGVEKHTLKVKDIALSDKGVYRCIAYRGDYYLGQTIRGLNLYRPVSSGIQNYKKNIIVAFVAAIIFLAIAVALCGVLHLKYESGSDVLVKASATTQDTQASQDTEAHEDTEVDAEAEAEAAKDANESARTMEAGIRNPAFHHDPAFHYDKHVEAMVLEMDTRM